MIESKSKIEIVDETSAPGQNLIVNLFLIYTHAKEEEKKPWYPPPPTFLEFFAQASIGQDAVTV